MKEEEYCDISDLVAFRAITPMLNKAHCRDKSHQRKIDRMVKDLYSIISALEPKVFIYLNQEPECEDR